MSDDKRTIGITAANAPVLDALVKDGHFGSELEAAKFAMAHAARSGVPVGQAEGAGTKWNVGTVDGDGSLRAVVEALYPDASEPYRLVEHLINEGLKMLAGRDGLQSDVAGVLFDASDA